MARKRNDGFDDEAFDDDRLVLDPDAFEDDEAETLAALAALTGGGARATYEY